MKSKEMKLLKSRIRGVGIIITMIFITIIVRVFFVEIYRIPSSSMEPALLPGDIIIICKMSYGARFMGYNDLSKRGIGYFRMRGWNLIKKGDVFVFNRPNYDAVISSNESIYGGIMVKRCYTLPGDSVLIRIKNAKKCTEGESINTDQVHLFPYDSILNWTLEEYGPLYVPAKNETIELTHKNLFWYNDVLKYENPIESLTFSINENGDSVVNKYKFKHNYYFMLGDNFYDSFDSRYWGFVPEGNIIGKVVAVVISLDPNKKGFKKFRWNRVLRIL